MVLAAIERQPPVSKILAPWLIRLPIDDALSLTIAEIQQVLRTARRVAERVAAKERIVVTCNLGLNRSGLVVAMALCMLGITSNDAIQLVRLARGPTALSNPYFLRLVREATT